jgi:hypothetical protein
VGSQNRNPNSLELHPYDDLDDARRAAIGWVGENRPVAPEKVPATALTGIADVIRDPAVLPKYVP